MMDYLFSEHAREMMRERNIEESWVSLAMENPDIKEVKEDGSVHYIKAIEEYGRRYLRVVVNPQQRPHRIITLFFDRRIGRLP